MINNINNFIYKIIMDINYKQPISFFVSLFVFLYLFVMKTIDLEISLANYKFTSLILLTCILILVYWKFEFKRHWPYIIIFLYDLFAFSVTGLFSKGSIITADNNDIYNWSLSTNTLLQFSNYNNIFPSGSSMWNGLRQDGFGSYVLNGFFSSLLNVNSLIFSAINLFIINLVIQFGLFKFITDKKDHFLGGFLASIFWMSNPLVLYLYANYFLGQLIATSLLFIALICYSSSVKANHSMMIRIIHLIPSFFSIFIVYQSGFVPLIVAFILLSYVDYFKGNIYNNRNLNYKFSSSLIHIKLFIKIIIDIIIAVLICFLLSPKTGMHFLHQVKFVSQVVAGWSLPLLSPLTLLGIPSPTTVDDPSQYNYYIWISLVLILLTFRKRYFVFNHISIGLLFFLFALFLYCISIFFNTRPNNYQIWKAASFIVLPLGIVFIGHAVNSNYRCFKGRLLLLLSFSIIASLNVLSINSSRYFSSKKNTVYNNFSNINFELLSSNASSNNILLDTEDWADTFIAFNTLSANFTLYPLGRWYGSSVLLNEINLLNFYIITNNCNDKTKEKYTLIDKDSLYKIYYILGSSGCGLLSKSVSFEGLYDAELNGRWSNGKNVVFNISTQNFKLNNYNFITFEIDPFLPIGVTSSEFDVYVDGKYFNQYKISALTNVSIPFLGSKENFKIDFIIKNTYKPKLTIPNSDDTRDISLFFKRIDLIKQ